MLGDTCKRWGGVGVIFGFNREAEHALETEIFLRVSIFPFRQTWCGRASWSLSPYGQRNCLLASIRDSKDRHTKVASKLSTQCVSRLSLSLIAMLS